MGWKFRLLDILSDPNIAYIFFMLGLYGLLFELYNPGAILPGVVGVISLILAFYSLAHAPGELRRARAHCVGIILFVLEIKITSYGLLTVGGTVSLLLGSIMLINSESSLEFVSHLLERHHSRRCLSPPSSSSSPSAWESGHRREKPVTGVEGHRRRNGRGIDRPLRRTARSGCTERSGAPRPREGIIPAGTRVRVVSVDGAAADRRRRRNDITHPKGAVNGSLRRCPLRRHLFRRHHSRQRHPHPPGIRAGRHLPARPADRRERARASSS